MAKPKTVREDKEMKKYIITVIVRDRHTGDNIGDDIHTFNCLSQAQNYYYETIGRYICGFKLSKVSIDTDIKSEPSFLKVCFMQDEATSIWVALGEINKRLTRGGKFHLNK